MKLTSLQKGSSCPICSSADGRCKTAPSGLILCMGVTEAVGVPGYVFKGLSKNKTWGLWAESQDSWDETDRQRWQLEQQLQRRHRLAAEHQRKSEAMPDADRDRHYQRLLSCLTLHPDDRADLQRRGLTDEQIQRWGVRSVTQWQQLPEDFPLHLPGIGLDGRSLNVATDGYLCPIRNLDGLIVGLQLRVRQPNQTGRYRWLTSLTKKRLNGATPHTANGELPLSIVRPAHLTRPAIALVEGTGTKPLITAERLGVITIGAAGGMFASSPETLKATLAALQPSEIELYPDAGSPKNHNIVRQYRALWELLRSWGYAVNIAWWGQVSKERDCDIDELSDLSTIQWISGSEFGAIAGETWDDGTSTVHLDLPNYDLTYPTQQIIHSRYLGDLQIPAEARLVGVRAPKGSGKTESLSKIVQTASYNGQKTLVLTYRESLGMQLGDRFGLPYKTEFWQDDVGRYFGYVLCVDSLHPYSEVPFHAQDYAGCLVIIDEAESVFSHLLNSDTCKTRRVAILEQFQQLLKLADRVILSDADLSDLSVRFVQQLMPDQPTPFILRSPGQSAGWTVFSYPSAARLMGTLAQQANDGKHLVLCCGQRNNSTWGTQTVEGALHSQYPHLKILRLDRETIGNPDHPAYMATAHLNELLTQFDVIVASPSIESGISIDLHDWFTAVWCFGTGPLPESSLRQFLARLRDNTVPRHIYVAERGSHQTFFGSQQTDPATLLRNEQTKTTQILKCLQTASIQIDDSGRPIFNPAAIEAWGAFGARVNRGLAKYRDAVLAGLAQEGHTIYPIDTPKTEQDKVIADQMRSLASTHHVAFAAATEQADDIDDATYQRLRTQKTKTDAERRAEHKAQLRQRYQIPVTQDLVLKDSEGWYSLLKVHYYLTIGADYLKPTESAKLDSISHKASAFIPDISKTCISDRISLLKELQIDRLIVDAQANGTLYYNEHPDIQAIAQRARHHKAAVKLHLDIEVSDQNKEMTIVQELLRQSVGFALWKHGQKRIDGKPQHTYRFPTEAQFTHLAANTPTLADRPQIHPFDGRDRVFAAWLDRDRTGAQNPSQPAIATADPAGVTVKPIRSNSAVAVTSFSVTKSGVTSVSGFSERCDKAEIDSTESKNECNGDRSPGVYQIGDRVLTAVGRGTICQIEGNECRVEGSHFLRWFWITEVGLAVMVPLRKLNIGQFCDRLDFTLSS